MLKGKLNKKTRNETSRSTPKRSLWTQPEDEILLTSVEIYGRKNWKMVAKHLKGRTGKQCRERFLNHVSPELNKSPWSEEEDQLLIAAHMQIGNKWTKLAKLLPGRSENSIKNHWHSSLRKRQLFTNDEAICKNDHNALLNNSDFKFRIIKEEFCNDSGYNDSSCLEAYEQFYNTPKVKNFHNYSDTINDTHQNSLYFWQLVDLVRCASKNSCVQHSINKLKNATYSSNSKMSESIPFDENEFPIKCELKSPTQSPFHNEPTKFFKFEKQFSSVTTPKKSNDTYDLQCNEITPVPLLSTPQNASSRSVDKNSCLLICLEQEFGTPETPTPMKNISSKFKKEKDIYENCFVENSLQDDCTIENETIEIDPSFNLSQSSFEKYLNSSPQNVSCNFSLINTSTPKVLKKVFISKCRSPHSSSGSSKILLFPSRIRRKAKKRLSFSEATNCSELAPASSTDESNLSSWEKIVYGRTHNQIILTNLAHDFLKNIQKRTYII